MNTFAAKAGWALAALLCITLVAIWSGVIQAGPLDPPGAPAPTMKTLDDLAPSWHRTLSSAGGCASERFSCVLGGQAVLDRETGLVWESAPQTTTVAWDTAIVQCQQAYHGSRLGWRLPSVSELMTLMDTGSAAGLPTGHPFSVGADDNFWSATENTASPLNRAARVDIDAFLSFDDLKTAAYRAWCVRAPAGADRQ